MSLSKYEKETIINFNEEESTANIFTASPAMAKKLAKLGEVRQLSPETWEIDIPKAWVKLMKPHKVSETSKNALKKARSNR